MLLIGRNALQGMAKLPFTAQEIEQGLRVVIFEQHCAEWSRLGFRPDDRCSRAVFLRQPDHPLLRGVSNDALHDWRGEATLFSPGPTPKLATAPNRFFHWGNRGVVASAMLETPHFGPFQSLLDCEFDLSYSPLLSWRHGKGEVIYCALDLTGRVGNEPAATRIATNLIQYLSAPLPGRQAKSAVCLDEAVAQRMAALGFAVHSWTGKPVAGSEVLVVDGAKAEAFAAHRADIAAFANAGGDVLVLDAHAGLAADAFFGNRLTVKEVVLSRAGRSVPAHPLLRGVGPQNLHWREPVTLRAVASTAPGYVSLLDGLFGVLPVGHGRVIFLQSVPESQADLSGAEAMDAAARGKNAGPVKPEARLADRKRSVWQLSRLESLVLGNLGVRASDALAARLLAFRKEITVAPVDRWVYLGPFAPGNPNGNPLERDLSDYLKQRDTGTKFPEEGGHAVAWYFPTDANNGLGLAGKMDMAKAFGHKLQQVGIAVTQVWSTRPRTAVIHCGADWWLKIAVNGKEVFNSNTGGFDINFNNKATVPLQAGWNDVVCTVGAGSNGHVFWFNIDDPGDLHIAQSTTPPTAPPPDLPPTDQLADTAAPAGFSLYTEPLPLSQDPYQFIAW